MGVGGALSEEPQVDVDDRRRREGVQLRRRRGHRRREDGREDEADDAGREDLEDEAEEDVVRVASVGAGARLLHETGDVGTDGAEARVGRFERLPGRLARRGVVAPRGLHVVERLLAPLLESLPVPRLEGGELSRARAGLDPLRLHRVEEDRREDELVEGEDHRADEEDDELHRHLDQAVREEAEAALGDGGAREVALYLRLVGAEVGEREEEAADEAGPEVVAARRVEGEVDGVQPPEPTGDADGAGEADLVGEEPEEEDEGRPHADEDDEELLELRRVHRLRPSRRDVDDDERPRERRRDGDGPPEEDGEDERRGVDRQAAREAALEEEEEGRQAADPYVEALLEVLVGRVDVQPVVERDSGDREDDHRERQAEVELDEAHPVGVGLPRRREEGDGARLRRHDREADDPPRGGAARHEVALHVRLVAALRDAPGDDEDERRPEDAPVEERHRNALAKSQKRTISSASAPRTTA